MKKRYKQRASGAQQAAGKRKMSVLRFGKPEPVLTTGTDGDWRFSRFTNTNMFTSRNDARH